MNADHKPRITESSPPADPNLSSSLDELSNDASNPPLSPSAQPMKQEEPLVASHPPEVQTPLHRLQPSIDLPSPSSIPLQKPQAIRTNLTHTPIQSPPQSVSLLPSPDLKAGDSVQSQSGTNQKKRKRSPSKQESKLHHRPQISPSHRPTDGLAVHPSPPQSLPLTRENLGLVTGSMPAKPSTRAQNTTQASTKTTNTSSGFSVERLLAMNSILIEDPVARDTDGYKTVVDDTHAVLDVERHSPNVGGHEDKYWKELQEDYYEANEATYRDQFFMPFVGRERNVKDDDGMWGKRAWRLDGLDVNSNQPFQRQSLPRINASGDWRKKFNRKTHSRVKNPVPDLAYGLHSKQFSQLEMDILMYYNIYTGISERIWLPGVIIEFKQQNMRAAKAQVARGGSALSNTLHQLGIAAGRDMMALGADTKSVVRSIAMTHELARMFVHWINISKHPDTGALITTFHMHQVASWTFEYGTRGIFDQRKALNNLLQDLVGARKIWVKQLLADIATHGDARKIPKTIALQEEGTDFAKGDGDDGDSEDEDEDEAYGGSNELCGGVEQENSGDEVGAGGKKRKQRA